MQSVERKRQIVIPGYSTEEVLYVGAPCSKASSLKKSLVRSVAHTLTEGSLAATAEGGYIYSC